LATTEPNTKVSILTFMLATGTAMGWHTNFRCDRLDGANRRKGATVPEVPAYLRIAADLRARIASGDLPPGAKLPTEAALAEQYGVSRTAVKWAVNSLKGAGLVQGRRGSGVYVRQFARIRRVSPDRLARDRWTAGRSIQDHDTGDRPRAVTVEVAEQPAPPAVAEALGVDHDAPVLIRARRFTVDDRPVQLATSYLPLDLAAGTPMTQSDAGPGGTYARLADAGQAPARFTERVVARPPDPQEAERLALDTIGALVVEVTRHAYTAAGRCVELSVMVLDAAAYELVYEFEA
jgi:GntR family transcriptional regulator